MTRDLLELQPSFILHTRAYRDNSFILELFTQEHGRVPLVARGARTRKAWQGLLQPFIPILCSWAGKGELMNLRTLEQQGKPFWLTGRKLLSGFYLNELLMRLLHRFDPHPHLFDYYVAALEQLVTVDKEEYVLRLFEKRLLDEIGYGLLFHDVDAIVAEHYYRFESNQGLIPLGSEAGGLQNVFSGRTLLALVNEDLDAQELNAAKRLMRLALNDLLGDKPLKTRELFLKS